MLVDSNKNSHLHRSCDVFERIQEPKTLLAVVNARLEVNLIMKNPLFLLAPKLQVVGGYILRCSLLPAKELWFRWTLKRDLK